MPKAPDFSKETVKTLAERAGYRCSNPDCAVQTVGPSETESKSIVIGEGAHIKGARLGTARFDSKMSDVARASISNGIWLCRNCHKMIDRDEIQFSSSLLLIWRNLHEREISMSLGKKTDIIRTKIADEHLSQFSKYSEEVRRIIIDKPRTWEFTLTSRLLRECLEEPLSDFEDLEAGYYVRTPRHLSKSDYLDWMSLKMHQLVQYIEVLKNLLESAVPESWGALGQPGDEVKIRDTCERLATVYRQVLEWEEEVRSIHTDEALEPLTRIFIGCGKRQLDKVAHIPDTLDTLVEKSKNHTKENPLIAEESISFDLPEDFNDSIENELSKLRGYFSQ